MLKFLFSESAAQREKRFACIRYLARHRAAVGLTSSASARSKFLLAIHTRGSPLMRIPPRPVVQPALARESLHAEMAEAMLSSCQAAMNGDFSGTKAGLETAGQAGADGIRAYIDAGISPPNAPVTLSGGWIRNRVTGKGVPVAAKNGSTPMKDTGALYHDFGFEITER